MLASLSIGKCDDELYDCDWLCTRWVKGNLVYYKSRPCASNSCCLFLFYLIRVAELYEYAMLPEHMNSPDPTVGPNSITETGALCISSGSKTGRVPKQKRIVEDDMTRDVSNHTNFRGQTHPDFLMNLENIYATTFYSACWLLLYLFSPSLCLTVTAGRTQEKKMALSLSEAYW